MIRLVAIIQARMGSERLPGKILMPLAGKPMLAHVVNRARRAAGVSEVVVATSTQPRDDELVEVCARLDVRCVRGSETDVLSRYHLAAAESRAEAIMRVTSDCPLLSPLVSGQIAATYLLHPERWDHVSNIVARTFPRGLDTEVFSLAALERAHREAVEPPDREHVTAYIWRQPHRFRCQAVVDSESHAELRWTVDTTQDYELLRLLFEKLGDGAEYPEILAYIKKNPELALINQAIEQKKIGI